MKKILCFILVLCIVFAFASCGNTESPEVVEESEVPERSHVKITMEDGGEIILELIPEYAPQTVENFLQLVKSGFYDGLTFHRIISGFMIQGGDPEGTGNGGSGRHVYGEFAANGFKKNLLKHARGVLSMARAEHFDSASSQFFIVHQDSPHLDGQYAAFGKVISGMEAVDKIAAVEVDENNKPLEAVVIKSIEVIEK